MQIALSVQYDGSRYHGWQRQNGLITVQEELEKALSRVADEKITVIGSGRTDTGVHALSQVVNFETSVFRPERAWVFGTNSYLPKDICVNWAKALPDDEEHDFHARYSAESRRYHYYIYCNPTRPAIFFDKLTWNYFSLDANLMAEAGKSLIGEHDFTSFRAVGCQAKHAIREIYDLDVEQVGSVVRISVRANGFLYHMVRNIAGVLIEVGSRRKSVHWPAELLQQRDRAQGGVTAPASGLYFLGPSYPDKYNLPKTSPQLVFWS